jgi:PAS domain S-box-containing protein
MGVNLEQVTLAEVMIEHPVTLKISEFTNIFVVLNLFRQHQILYLVVIDDDGNLVGVVTQNSIFNTFDPLQMYEEINVLRQKVCQLENEKTEILQKKNTEIELQVQARTMKIMEKAKSNQLLAMLSQKIRKSQYYQQAHKELKEWMLTEAKLKKLNERLELRVMERTAQLHQSQEYLHQITENIDSVFWMTNLEKNQILYVSIAYERIWGYSCEDLYQSSQKWVDFIHPEDLPRIKAALPNQISGKYNEQYRIIRGDGEIRWINDRAFPIHDQEGNIYRIAGIAEDITQRKQIEETLKLQERAIAASNNGIVIVDARLPDKNTIFVNTAFEKITGYSASEVMGENCRFLQGKDRQQPGLKDIRLALKMQQNCNVTLRNYRKDGSLFWNELSISPIFDDHGNLTHFIGIQNDVTARKQAEEQIRSSLQEKEILLKEVHHRVKNNLVVVSSLLDWQADYLTDPAAIKIFEQSQYRIQSMALIHEKLYQSKNLAKIDLSEYLQTLAQQLAFSSNLDNERITIDFDLHPILLNIETATPCGLIVNELISNVFEHAFPNHETGQIWLKVKENAQNQVTITIQDNGVGFPADLDFQNTESLGLQLVCLLTKQLEGEITVSCNHGTTFKLIFSELRYQKRIENYENR